MPVYAKLDELSQFSDALHKARQAFNVTHTEFMLSRDDRIRRRRLELFAHGRDVLKLSTRAMALSGEVAHSTIARGLKAYDAAAAKRDALAKATAEGPDRGERLVADPEGELQCLQTGLTPIDRLVKRHILPSAAGLASRRYHVDFMRAGEGGRQRSQLARYSGKTGAPDPERQEAERLDAQARLAALHERLTGSQRSILAHVCGTERSLPEWAFGAGLAQPVAIGILYSALEVASRHYGFRWPAPANARAA